ncbi:hypothetical protein [Cohnella hashimotonis]|uniref:Uncharacterized protein n=1 Tax=Cohnella hashimotonis TaxID=2826895 RepID=A0ABT6TA29_9BACL|nr:hypothetical protein [Cohnella hashimotonis]MDI4643684.1 hypothetical protein [Cohnella hashimotonis]
MFIAILIVVLAGLAEIGGISFVMWHDEGAIKQPLRESALSPALRVHLGIARRFSSIIFLSVII